MARLFFVMGPFAWPMLLIAIANLVLAVWRGSQVFGGAARRDPKLEAGINTILFWGVIAAVLGYLSMYLGAYYSLTAIAKLEAVGHRLLSVSMLEILLSPIAGLSICVLSSIAWFGLRARYLQLAD